MYNEQELNRHKKSDSLKWILAFSLIAVLLVGMVASLILAVNNGKDKPADNPAVEESVNDFVTSIRDNSKIGYAFKQKIIRLVKSVCEKDIQGICFDLQSDGKMSLLVVQIGKVQFSFHEIYKEEISPLLNQHSQLQSNLEWDGIRKQICATTTFYLSEESTQNLMTVSGGPIEVELDRIKNKILSNQTTIRDIVSAPCQNKEKKQSCLTSGATLGDILKAQGIDLMMMISDK